jgi:C4-type Zn-finger protein
MSEKNKKKIQKSFGRPCPDCEGKLVKVVHKNNLKGVILSETFIECMECGYFEKLDVSKKESKEELILRGKEYRRKVNNFGPKKNH